MYIKTYKSHLDFFNVMELYNVVLFKKTSHFSVIVKVNIYKKNYN